MSTNQRLHSRRGIAMAYVVVIITVSVAIASFAVDFGRVQMAKTQLRMAADAAARAAATQLGTNVGSAQNLAYNMAYANYCDGERVTINKSQDVEFLDWDPTTRTYTVLTGMACSSANAVRVTTRRTGANGIPLSFGWVAGMQRFDVTASAIAAMLPPDYGLVGINYISLKGNSSASYWSSTGSVSGNAGNIASNGNISSSNNSTIQGTIWKTANATVSGISANAIRILPTPLNFPNGSSGSYSTTNNDNGLITPNNVLSNGPDLGLGNNRTATFPAGNYVFRNVNVNAGGTIACNGEVTIYFFGTFSMNGQATTYSSVPQNLKIIGIPNPGNGNATGSLSIGSSAALYANIYAPQSDITLSGSGAIYGQVIGKSVTMTGSSDIYYDLTGAGGNILQIVK